MILLEITETSGELYADTTILAPAPRDVLLNPASDRPDDVVADAAALYPR